MDAKKENRTVWTIGHSTHPLELFVQMLQSFQVRLLADVRRYPGSRRYPHFNSAELQSALAEVGIGYIHFEQLGGRRQPSKDSSNLAWRLPAFRGYADYIETEPFKISIEQLQKQARLNNTAYMCSEAPWWRCHRSIISDYLKSQGWTVMHIMKPGKAEEHPYTSAASIVNGKLDYSGNSLRFE
jgi:uncharacterized protein (DUF488 family)